jgi:hypothetical protein
MAVERSQPFLSETEREVATKALKALDPRDGQPRFLNLELTGIEPLTDYDCRRIAVCE